MEIVMVLTLAVMGIYFFKSTDLPKDLKERSIQMQAESSRKVETKTLKMTFPKIAEESKGLSSRDLEIKLSEIKAKKNLVEIKLINAEIDKLTLIITSLEQEIRANNERNNEIQDLIETHLITLQSLQDKITTLA